MSYDAAYALLFLVGNANPKVEEVLDVVRVAGLNVDRQDVEE